MQLLQNFISVFDQILALLRTPPKESLHSVCTLQTPLTVCRVGVGGDGPHKAVCSFWRQVVPAGPDCSSILYPYACAPKSIKTSPAPPSLEYINYVNIQTVPPAIPSWYSYLRTNYIAQKRRHKGRVYNMDTHVKTQLSFHTVTKRKAIQGAASHLLKCTFFISSLKAATNEILLPLFSPACDPFKVLFSCISLSFCCYVSLSYKVHFYTVSDEIKPLYTTYYSLEIFHRIIPLIFFMLFSVMSEILIFFPTLSYPHTPNVFILLCVMPPKHMLHAY